MNATFQLLIALGVIAVPAVCACLCAHWAGRARRHSARAEGAARQARVSAHVTAITTPDELVRRRAEVAEMRDVLRERTGGKP